MSFLCKVFGHQPITVFCNKHQSVLTFCQRCGVEGKMKERHGQR